MKPSELTQETLSRYIDVVGEWETALSNHGAAVKWLADEGYEELTVKDAICEQVLEVIRHFDTPRPWLPLAPTIMVTYGGPSVWVSAIESGWIRITVVWGDSATHDQYSPEVANLIKEMANPEGY